MVIEEKKDDKDKFITADVNKSDDRLDVGEHKALMKDMSQTLEVSNNSPRLFKRINSARGNDTLVTSALLNETLTSRSDVDYLKTA